MIRSCLGLMMSKGAALHRAEKRNVERALLQRHRFGPFTQSCLLLLRSVVTSPSLEEQYQQALRAIERLETHRHKKEEKRSLEQYKAYQRGVKRQSENNIKTSGGVAVMKTIAKQTRKEQEREKREEEELEEAARRLLFLAGQEGHPDALVRLGNESLKEAKNNNNDEPDRVSDKVNEALDFYQRAGENGSTEGWFNRGQLLWTGYPDHSEEAEVTTEQIEIILPRDVAAASESFQRAVDLGDLDSMYFLGVQRLSNETASDSLGTRRSGLDLIEAAANKLHPGALYYRALLMRNGNEQLGIEPCSTDEFVRYLDMAADVGDADALFLRGHNYFNGDDGRVVDKQAALNDFVASAEAGNSDAAVSAGAIMHHLQRYEEAFQLYQLAADAGNVEGWRNVVACYMTGEGVPKCEDTAKYIARTMLTEDEVVPS